MARLTAKVQRKFPIPNDEDKAELTILHLFPGEVRRIEAETSEWTGKSVDDQFQSELKFNPYSQATKLRLASLVGWKGFFDEDGIAIDCNLKNKILFLAQDPEVGEDEEGKALPLTEWVDKFRKVLADEQRPKEEEAEKN